LNDEKEDRYSIEYKQYSFRQNDHPLENETTNQWNDVPLTFENKQCHYCCIQSLNQNTAYIFRLIDRNCCYSALSHSFLICQTQKEKESLLCFNEKSIWNESKVQLENSNTLLRVISFTFQGISVSLPSSNAVSSGTHCWRFHFRNDQPCIGPTILAIVNAKKQFQNGALDQDELWGIDGKDSGEWNNGKFMKSKSTWQWFNKKEYTIDMKFDVEEKDLQWKEVTDNGKGLDYSLQFSNSLNGSLFVPHVWVQNVHTCVQVFKISPLYFGLHLSRTSTFFQTFSS